MGIVVASVSIYVLLISECVGAWLWKVGESVDYVYRCWTSEWLSVVVCVDVPYRGGRCGFKCLTTVGVVELNVVCEGLLR